MTWCLLGGCQEVVLDAELVAIDREKANELKSFQELSTRARGAITALEVPHPCIQTLNMI